MNREEILELAGHRDVPPWVMKLVADCVAREREECAKVCDRHDDGGRTNNADMCAYAIRARGNQ